MEERSKYLHDLGEIRSIMERSSKFISLSGLSGVGAGTIALLGAAAAKYIIHQDLNKGRSDLSPITSIWEYGIMDISLQAVYTLMLLGIITLIASLGFAYYFTKQRAKSINEKIWNAGTKKMAFHLFVPLIAGGLFTLILISKGFYGFVAPVTLIFYGLACVSASHYTPSDIKSLGMVMLLLGLIGTQFIGYGLLFWAIGFGLCHIIYGYLMYIKYEKK